MFRKIELKLGMSEDRYISTTEAAKIAGCTLATIHKWMGLKNAFEFKDHIIGVRKVYKINKASFLEFWVKRKKEIGK